LFLPGLKKLRKLYDSNFFGRVLSIRLDFGWWVFDGDLFPAQRPSWNYQKATGGGLILDMFAHWRYIFDRLLGSISAVSCRQAKAVLQPRAAAADEFRRAVAGSAGRAALRKRLPSRLAIVPAPCRRGRAVFGAAPRRRQKRPARRSVLQERSRASLGRAGTA